MSEFKADISSDNWFNRINVDYPSNDVKRSILEFNKNELDFSRLVRFLI